MTCFFLSVLRKVLEKPEMILLNLPYYLGIDLIESARVLGKEFTGWRPVWEDLRLTRYRGMYKECISGASLLRKG